MARKSDVLQQIDELIGVLDEMGKAEDGCMWRKHKAALDSFRIYIDQLIEEADEAGDSSP